MQAWSARLSLWSITKSHATGYAQAVDAIDIILQNEATEAEMKRAGGGLMHIIEQLLQRGMRL
jgi:hypothetical protein